MTRITTQPPPRRLSPLEIIPRRAWAYGTAAVLFLAFSGVLLRTRLFPPAPLPSTEILASTKVNPGRSLEFADSQLSPLPKDFPFRIRKERAKAVESETLIADSAQAKESQDIVSMTLVSQETGLKVHWTFNRNFELKEEAKR